MTHLSQRDIQNLLAIGGIAGECQSLADLRDELLRRIQQTLNAPSGLFFRFAGDRVEGRFYDGFHRGVPDDAPRAWCHGYWRVDPFVDRFFQHLESGGSPVVVSSHILRKNDYEKSSFYCDFLRPQDVYHILVAGTVKDGLPTGILGLHRPPDEKVFTQSDILKVNLLLPYLAAAVEQVSLKQLLNARQSIIDALADDLARPAVLMVDQDFSTIIANEQATRLLGGSPEKQLAATALPPCIMDACNHLRAKWRDTELCPPANHTAVDFCLAGRPMQGVVRIETMNPACLRFIIYFGPAGRELLQPALMIKFGLSQRETDIVQLVSLGLTNAEIAYRLKISVRTVENHLRSIYGKVHVHNRTSLISHLARGH